MRDKKTPMPTKTETLLFALLLPLLILAEVACALLAYFTLGEVMSSFYVLPIGLNMLFAPLFFRRRRAAIVGIVILALLIIPVQVVLGIEVARVQVEATHIVTYVYSYRD